MFRIGDFEIHVLSGGHLYVDAGGPFGLVPRALWSRYQTPTDDHLLPMCLNCLLVKAHGKNILVDVGMGNKVDDKYRRRSRLTHPHGTLFEGLARLGLGAEDIDLVVNTHLHADHCENNTKFSDDGIVPTFPNAEYAVQRREYDDAMHPNERTRATYIPVNYEPVMDAGQMRLLDGDEEFFPGIKGIVTPGHTPGHMSVLVSAGDEHLFFACDLITYAIQLQRLAWMTAYDVEPLVTLETKREWQPWLLEHKAITVFPHDVTMMAARLVEDENGKPLLSPVDEAEGAVYT
jgi:glyoxylase-like metal-dependent hydrolase (beta-lactamase superfamily II)